MFVSRLPATALRHLRFAATAVLGVSLAAVMALGASGGAVSAAEGLSLPALAGTTWEIVGGYHTASHAEPDPWEIDIVRTDGETAGTPVLSPVSGELGYNNDGCLSIRMENSSVLLCHLLVDSTLARGQEIPRGMRLGVVAPAGMARNNGLAHIHLSAHDGTRGSGNTTPLTGAFSLEGRDFPATDEANAYAGTVIRSTNVQVAATNPPDAIPVSNEPSPVMIAGFQPAGFSLFLVTTGGATSDLVAAMSTAGADVGACLVASLIEGTWIIYAPAAPERINAYWNAVYADGLPDGVPLVSRCR